MIEQTTISIAALIATIITVWALLKIKKHGLAYISCRKNHMAHGCCHDLRIDETSTYSEEELSLYSIGNLHVGKFGGTLNTLGTGIDAAERTSMLQQDFVIDNRDRAIKKLKWLSTAPSQLTFHFAYEAYLKGKEGENWLRNSKELADSKELCDECIKQIKKLKRQYKEIMNAGIADSEYELGLLGVIAWDAGQLNFLSRACMEQGYINKDECMICLDAAFKMSHEAFSNWKDFAHSYALGFALYGDATCMAYMAEQLLNAKQSPWSYIKWE